MKRLLVSGILLAALWYWWSGGRPVHHAPGILIAEEPLQTPVPPGQTAAWKFRDMMIEPLAAYQFKARVLHPERYRWDRMADIAPMDLGVGWGVMSDETNVSRVLFSNSGRYLSWSYSGGNFPHGAAEASMTNMHLIPATGSVRDRLLSVRPGQLIQAGGWLVEVRRPGMNPWRSSLSRTDTGPGACEIMWLESLILLPPHAPRGAATASFFPPEPRAPSLRLAETGLRPALLPGKAASAFPAAGARWPRVGAAAIFPDFP